MVILTMKVLIVSRYPPFFIGGAEKLIRDLGLALAKIGYEVIYFSLKPKSSINELKKSEKLHMKYRFASVKARKGMISYASYFSEKVYKEYRKIIEVESPDLVIDNAAPIPYYPMHFFDTSMQKEIIKIIYVHAIFEDYGFKFMNPIFATLIYLHEKLYRLLKDAKIIVNGKSTRDRLKKLLRNIDKNIYILNPSINIKYFKPKIVLEETYALCLTRLDYRKDLETLLKAWKILDTDIVLKIAGDGPKKEMLLKLKEKLNLSNVEFLGKVNETEKIKLYRDAFIYILPTWFEGYGITILEAMASGTPVISYNTWGVRDIVIDGENGLLARPNPQELAKKISVLIDNKSLRLKLAKNGIKTAERHDFKIFIHKVKRIIDNIISEKDGSG